MTICILTSSIVFAQEEDSSTQEEEFANIRILLAVKSTDETVSLPLNGVISDSISLEFILENFDVLKEEMEERSVLMDKGKKSRSSYLVEARYTVDKGILSILLECYRMADKDLLYTGNIESPIGLDLDITIRDTTKELIDWINRDIRTNPQLVTFLVYEKEIAPVQEKPSVFVLSAALAPFIPVGSALEYFETGIGSDMQVLWRVDSSIGTFGLGLFLSACISRASGELNSSDNLFLSTGPYLTYLYPLSERISLTAQIYGGPALLMVNRNQKGYLNLTVPVFSGGLGSQFHLWKSSGLLFAVDFSTYFESSLFITGILPKIGVYFNR